MSPTNHYLNATNMLFLLTGSVALVRWVHVPSAWPLAGVAIWLYGSGLFLRKKDAGSHTSLYFILASVLFALSAFSFNTLVHTPGMYHAVRSAVWGILVLVLLLTGIRLKSDTFALSAFGIFLYAMVYWYGTAWSVEWVPVLGFKYIPFINPGGLVWIFYAAIGLGFSFYFKSRNDAKTLGGLGMSPRSLHLAALFLAHIIIMGLLTIQTSNVWDAYQLHSGMVRVTWVHSVIWTAYSLILFFTASQTHEKFFSTAASILLLATSIKVIFHDLQGQTNLVRALFLLAIGGLMMSIAWLLQKRLRDK